MKIAPHWQGRRGMAPVLILALAVGLTAATAAWAEPGYLGVHVQSVDKAMATALNLENADAVMVRDVVEDSPAEAAGLQQGDLILSIDGRDTKDPARFSRRVRRVDAGEKATLEVIRQGKKMNIEVTMGEADDREFYGRVGQDVRFFDVPSPDDSGITVVAPRGVRGFPAGSGAQLGVNVHGLDENLGRYFGADEGVLVLGVMEATAAEDAGFQEGDVILSLDGDQVGTTIDLHELIADYEPGDEVAIRFLRDKKEQTITVELGESDHFEFAREFRGRSRGHNLRIDRAPRAVRVHESRRGDLEEELEQMRMRLEKLEAELNRASEGN